MEPGASAALARRYAPGLVGGLDGGLADERPMGVDQSNLSVVVGEAVVVKWLTPPAPLPHPGVELLGHLANVGFHEIPSLLGVRIIDGRVEALVSTYVPGSQDGWEWYTDDVLAWLDAGARLSGAAYDAILVTARRMGALAARLHRALGQPSRSSLVQAAHGTTDGFRLALDATRLLDQALTVVDDDDEVWLRRARPAIEAEIAALRRIDTVVTQPTHGDLHAGQFLRSQGRLWVIDFDGNPLATDGSPPATTAHDLAGLVQSVDHVARVAHRRRPNVDRSVIDDLASRASAAVLGGYRAEAGGGLVDERLLRPLRVIQELHELVYAAYHLPHWRYVPAAALPALLAAGR